MKHMLFLSTLALLACSLHAQEDVHAKDSGTIVLENYYAILNVDNIPADSMLYIESYSVDASQPADTVFMRRWFGAPNQTRVEVTYHGQLVNGMQSDGNKVFRIFDTVKRQWKDVKSEKFYDMMAYDYRGPLYNWHAMGAELFYQGVWDFQGHKVHRVFVMQTGRYDRNYLFEKETGLLFFIDERDTHDQGMRKDRQGHVTWRAYHEYVPLNGSLYVSEESFMKDNSVTVTRHAYRFLPRSATPFTTKEKQMP